MPGPLQTRGLFPTRILALDLEPAAAQAFNAMLRAEVERLLSPRPALLPGQTWQTHHDLHRKPVFQPFVALVMQAAGRWMEEHRWARRDLAITGCWANLNPPGLSHNAHNHPNNLLSGVYYVQTGAGADVITFLDPRPQVLQVLPRFTQQTALNATELNVPAPEGRMVLFPGWLVHAVPSNRGNAERLSIAFNLTFPDEDA